MYIYIYIGLDIDILVSLPSVYLIYSLVLLLFWLQTWQNTSCSWID